MPIALFVGRRIAALVATLLISSVAIYGARAIAPGDPAALAQIRAEYHLDDPFWSQYWHWLTGLLHGDLGRSIVFRSDVADLLSGRIVNTLLLVAYAATLIVLAGVGLGLLAALRGRRVNQLVTVATTVAMGAPTFVMAIVLIWIFSTKLSWFPVYGAGEGLADKLWHLTLPAVALSCTWVAYVSQVTRASVASELRSEHVETARGRGLPNAAIVRHHVLRNAAGPILAVSGLTVAGLFAGTAVAEQAFGVNGIGSLLIESAAKQDLAVVMVLALLMVTAFVVVNTVVDVVNALLDPRLAEPQGAMA